MSRKACPVCGWMFCTRHMNKPAKAREGRRPPYGARVYTNSTPQEVEKALAELRALWAKPEGKE